MNNTNRRPIKVTMNPDYYHQLTLQDANFSAIMDDGARLHINHNLTEEGEIMNDMEKLKKEIKVLNNKYKFLEKKLDDLKKGKNTKTTREKVKMAERVNAGIKANNPLRSL